jgi:hypothetical protein
MKEVFEDRRLTGAINVACKYDDGTTRMWITRKEEVVAHIVSIVNEYKRLGYKLTLRQLHYQLVTKNWIVNHDTAYKKLGTILDDCRYGGIIDWDSIEDRGRVPYLPFSVDSVEEALQVIADAYKRDRQEGQNNVVELWTEKDALSGILKRSTEKYHVRLVVNKGYTSSSAIYGAYERVRGFITDGKRVTILYFGDHDPSGLDMVRDIKDRLVFMLSKGIYKFDEDDIEEHLIIKPIGLTKKQVDTYNLPPNPTKLTDTRSAGYIEKFGRTCWEVDALDPQTLTAIVETNIEGTIDMDAYEEMLDKEKADRKKIKKLIQIANDTEIDPE